AEPVHLGDPLPAERREAVPARIVGRAVGELVGAEMDRRGEPQAELVEGFEEREVLAQWPAILHADEAEALALARQPPGIVRGEREADPVAIPGEGPADRHRADQRGVA